MGNKFEPIIMMDIQRYNAERATLTKKLGNESISHFKDNWKKHGYDDRVVNPWKQRKLKDAGRAILVKSGRLRRSFNQFPTLNRTVVENDTPYGVYHNYGTTKLPQRKFMGRSRNLDEKCGVLIMRMMKKCIR